MRSRRRILRSRMPYENPASLQQIGLLLASASLVYFFGPVYTIN